jgi:hypothetical protein
MLTRTSHRRVEKSAFLGFGGGVRGFSWCTYSFSTRLLPTYAYVPRSTCAPRAAYAATAFSSLEAAAAAVAAAAAADLSAAADMRS